MRRDRPWLGAWRVSRSEVDFVRQTVETWCVMVSIIDQVMKYEQRGLLTVISFTQE